jgi:predicted metal-dependent TIM-barrel fold hydrolase
LAVATYGRFKQLPEPLQERYFRMIGVEEWGAIREELTSSYCKGGHSQIYFKAFQMILDKLEGQIKRGASIYGEEGQERTKRKEEVFSLFYKIAIIEAHKNIFQNARNSDPL